MQRPWGEFFLLICSPCLIQPVFLYQGPLTQEWHHTSTMMAQQTSLISQENVPQICPQDRWVQGVGDIFSIEVPSSKNKICQLVLS